MKAVDRYLMYETAVQEPETELRFFARAFRDAHDREPRRYREDFCGTFLNSCAWVRRHPENVAVAVDIDPVPLQYGLKHHAQSLKPSQLQRLVILNKNVLKVTHPLVDVVAASNFSCCFFKERAELVRYFQFCHRSLRSHGIVSIDLPGGLETGEPNQEKRKLRLPDGSRYTYIWEQKNYNPITQEAMCYIHFEFPDRKPMRRAFTYDWRLWSIPDVREAMQAAGFRQTYVYWEGDDGKGGGNSVFSRREKVENCDAWVVYIVGVKGK